jgi:hypothetical protein
VNNTLDGFKIVEAAAGHFHSVVRWVNVLEGWHEKIDSAMPLVLFFSK